jgi:signal transduction histidine kinase
VKAAIAGPIFDEVWKRMLLHYRSNIVKYMRQHVVASRNSKEIRLAEENTQYKLNMKYKRYLEKYLHGFLHSSQCQKRLAAVLTIQSSFRMFKVRHKFNSLRRAVLKIQRNWRKYSYDKY